MLLTYPLRSFDLDVTNIMRIGVFNIHTKRSDVLLAFTVSSASITKPDWCLVKFYLLIGVQVLRFDL